MDFQKHTFEKLYKKDKHCKNVQKLGLKKKNTSKNTLSMPNNDPRERITQHIPISKLIFYVQ